MPELKCLRCGYHWRPRKSVIGDRPPRECPSCKSRAWNVRPAGTG